MSLRWRRALLALAGVVLLPLGVVAVVAVRFSTRLERVEPDERSEFRSPYYLYYPRSADAGGGTLHLLVEPNNTGHPDDDPATHARQSLLRTYRTKWMAEELGVPLLVPCFPRPAAQWRVYTHALDRDTFTTDVPELSRLDRQLLAMIDDARARLSGRTGRAVDPRVLIMGFSANGMFANRFTVLHPERVLASAAGSPGGWPLVPVTEWRGRSLRYPIGIADVGTLLDARPDLARLRDVRVFVFQGAEDTNDSVAYKDGWDPEDRDCVNELFGSDLRARFAAAEELWHGVLPDAAFKLYAGAGHSRTAEMDADVITFFAAAIAAQA